MTTISLSEIQAVRYTHLELVTDREKVIRTQADVLDLFRDTKMHKAPQESFWVLAFGSGLHVATMFEVNRGTYNGVTLHIAALLSGVLVAGVDRFTIAHNHPGGELKPTEDDVRVTRNVAIAADAVRLTLVDHLILAPSGQHYSFQAHGKMPVLPSGKEAWM